MSGLEKSIASNSPRKISIFKNKLRRVRRELFKSLRMDHSTEPHLDIVSSPFYPNGDYHVDSDTFFSDSPPYNPSSPGFDNDMEMTTPQLDGPASIFSRRGRTTAGPPVAAIFVHAGAGYHSITNEQFHLGACNDACKMAMKILKQGGSAVDAVEAAIRVLEDREITNAGYGSNLCITGRVEGDATVVDHLGRSGACGATPQIKNPINLARLILEHSNRPLTLRRVPPNLLVGQGATDFAREHGMTIVPHESIISKSALERYTRWKDDLRRAELQKQTSHYAPSYYSQISLEDEEGHSKRDHTNAILTGTWNEGQPDSPAPGSPATSTIFYPNPNPDQEGILGTPGTKPNTPPPATAPSRTSLRSPMSSSHSHSGSPASKRPRYVNRTSEGPPRTQSPLGHQIDCISSRHTPSNSDGAGSPIREGATILNQANLLHPNKVDSLNLDGERGDHITDTVGAIAIDINGNIAAASSSGGIGMKHSGRVGPAALVGVGSAVIPVDDQDPEGISVAAVTSGTGEHMATTVASQKCCERLYNNTKKGPGTRGADVSCTEEEAIESFISWDFMEHPGVRISHSAGAIGVMAVKKMQGGYYLHFAHNTDSFALASMHSNENQAKCVMSRLGDRMKVVQGGRKIRPE